MQANLLPSASLPHLMSRLGICQGPAGTPTSREWNIDTLRGSFVELSSPAAGASLTAAIALVVMAQRQGEPAAWITSGASVFYPPDVADSGVDLDALPVVRVTDTRGAMRAAEHLLRSGGFGIVVADLGADSHVRMPAQSRLSGLAKKHRTAFLCLTRKKTDAPSIGSLVSVRGEAVATRTDADHFTWEVKVLKDKKRGPGWRHSALCRGPEGLG